MSDPILGSRIERPGREELLARFPPTYSETVADHVTWGRRSQAPPMPRADKAVVVGRADDGRGVEALVVEIGGSTERWDGGIYHVTWSLAAGREAKESNDIIAERGWQALERGPELSLTPGEWS